VGLVGILVPILPGLVLVLGAILVWAIDVGGATAWTVFAVASVSVVVGCFVIPVIGLFIGFVLGVYLAELRRVGAASAWPSTKEALRAVGVSILIELAAGVLAALVWVAGVVAT